ncbi:MAG TPA: glycosyltransferase [Candidatus Poseidoniales archaeon]|nr:glycosyltransferase [Candidatus Poseidoniales archaeon]
MVVDTMTSIPCPIPSALGTNGYMLSPQITIGALFSEGISYKSNSGWVHVGEVQKVATVIPTLNEVDSITRCIKSLLRQTYPVESHRIIIVDGGSTDGTIGTVEGLIAGAGEDQPLIELLDNPGKFTPQARNIALQHLDGAADFIFEMNAHAHVPYDHIESRIADMLDIEAKEGNKIAGVGTLVRSDEQNIGMFGRWVEATLVSPLGNSGGQFAQFRGREKHHIPAFVIHRREALESVGGWDERYHTTQDSDLSMRLLKKNWQLWRSDISHINMRKRRSMASFIKMSWRYGAWRMESLKRHPERGSVREILPALGIVLTLLLVIFAADYWYYPVLAYALVLTLDAVRGAVSQRQPTLLLGLPICLMILHVFFTLGMLSSTFRRAGDITDR